MGDSLITVIAIALAAILMFVFPLMTMSDRTDDIAQLTVESATTEFVEDVRITGKITPDKYSKFEEKLTSTGNTYDVEMEVKVLDENPGKKSTIAQSTKIGENVYYSEYTSQILNKIEPTSGTATAYILKEGDIFTATVKNTSQTLAQQLKGFFYSVVGNNTYIIAAQHTATVTANGSGK